MRLLYAVGLIEKILHRVYDKNLLTLMQQLLAKPWYDMSLYNLPSTGDYIDGMVIDWSSS